MLDDLICVSAQSRWKFIQCKQCFKVFYSNHPAEKFMKSLVEGKQILT